MTQIIERGTRKISEDRYVTYNYVMVLREWVATVHSHDGAYFETPYQSKDKTQAIINAVHNMEKR